MRPHPEHVDACASAQAVHHAAPSTLVEFPVGTRFEQ